MKILVIEDDVLLADFIARCLKQSGFDVETAQDGLTGFNLAKRKGYDAIVLDIALPKLLGTEICVQLRALHVMTPILFLSSYKTKEDKIHGLDIGADDYLVKPFGHEELVARVRALTRRPPHYVEPVIRFGDISIDCAKREVCAGGHVLRLTPKEFQLLEVLARNSDTVLSREYLLNHIWGVTIGNTSNRLEVCIRGLRNKLRSISGDDVISTEYGVGYKLSK